MHTLSPETVQQALATLNLASLDDVMGYEQDGVNALIFSLFWGANLAPERIALVKTILAELGVEPEGPAGAREVLAAMSAMTEVEENSPEFYTRQTYATAVALKADDPFAALTILDGPSGAGIGWTITADELREHIPAE